MQRALPLAGVWSRALAMNAPVWSAAALPVTLGLACEVAGPAVPPASSVQEPRPLDQMVAQIRQIVPRRLQSEGLSGVAVAVVGPGFVWTAGFGYTHTTRERAVDADTLFSVQSMTKVFTATAVMSAVEDGLLDLDAPITQWLPELTLRTRFASRPQDRITLRLLLSHQAGLTHEAPVGNNFSAEPDSFDAHVASIPDSWLRFPVGLRTSYSNLGVDLAGSALQAASGIPFADAVRERVLEPAGMRRSAFATEALRAEENLAVGDSPGAESVPFVIPIQAAGGLYSSANDLARFLRIALDRGAPIVGPESWAEMQQIAAPVSDFQHRGMGLGLIVAHRADDRIVAAGHSGGGYGFQSELIWLAEVGIGFALLQNSTRASGLRREIAKLLEETAREQSGRDPFPPGSALQADAPCREAREVEMTSAIGAYVSRSSNAAVTTDGDAWGVLSRSFQAMCFATDEDMVSREKKLHDAWRLIRSDDGRPERLVGLNSGTVFEYNDGPADPVGPGYPQWRSQLGTWMYEILGSTPVYLPLYEQHGSLYFDDLRLTRFGPGLFYASNGEVLNLASDPPIWRSLSLERHALQHSADDQRKALTRARAHYELLRAEDFDALLSASSPTLRNALGTRLPEIWRQLLEASGAAGSATSGRVDVVGSRTRVRLAVPFQSGTQTLHIMLDDDGRADSFRFDSTQPRSWWLHHAAPAG